MADKKIVSKLNYLRMSPRKVRLVADLIKRRNVAEARTQLKFLTKRAAKPLFKLLNSGIANAEKNFGVKKENLIIEKIMVGEGPVLKRFRPRAFGRAFPIRKRTSHITLELAEKKRK